MFWHGMPPELNTARLMAGAGAAPMLQAAAGWEALAIFLETQADELAASLAALTSVWSGSASERAVTATMPMVLWLRTVSLQAQKRALQATRRRILQPAMASTPPLAEIEQNHITHAVLEGTNFFGINTIPIGLNEFDYLVRMWNQAAATMDAYQAETGLNMMFERIMTAQPIVIPGAARVSPGRRSVKPQRWRLRRHCAMPRSRRPAPRPRWNRLVCRPAGRRRQATWPPSAPKASPEGGERGPASGPPGPDAAGHADGHADGFPTRLDPRPTSAAGQPDGHATDAAVDPAAAAGDLDVQPDGQRWAATRRSDGTDRSQPAVQSPAGRWIWTGFGRRIGARRVSPGRRRHVARTPLMSSLIGETSPRYRLARRCRRGRRQRRWPAPVGAGGGGGAPMGRHGPTRQERRDEVRQ